MAARSLNPSRPSHWSRQLIVVLLSESERASMLVIGQKGGGRRSDMAMGPVAVTCGRQASVPVAIVPSGTAERTPKYAAAALSRHAERADLVAIGGRPGE